METVGRSSKHTGSSALFLGGLAATLASACCLGPLIMVMLGVSGAWIGNLTELEPYHWYFIAASVLALFFAGLRIFRPARACAAGEMCAMPLPRRIYKILFGIVSALVFLAVVFPYIAKFFY